MSVPIRIIDARTGKPVKFDSLTGEIAIIAGEHHEIHDGRHFTYSYVDADWDIADAQEILIVVPPEVKPHIFGVIKASYQTSVEFYEGATHTIGAERVPYNNNRNSDYQNRTKLYSHADDGADGTLIFADVFGTAGIPFFARGGETRAEDEWILKENTKYLLKAISAVANNSLGLRLFWYEPEEE